MNVLGRARRLESTIAARLDDAAKSMVRPRPREPLEILLAILDAVEQRIEPTGRGARVFPFNRIELSVLAPSPETRGRLEAVLGGDTPLRARILDRVHCAGCSAADVVVEIQYSGRAAPHWSAPEFDLQFARVAVPRGPPVARGASRTDQHQGAPWRHRAAGVRIDRARASTWAGALRSETTATGSFERIRSRSPKEAAMPTRPFRGRMPTLPTSRAPVISDCTMTAANTAARSCAAAGRFQSTAGHVGFDCNRTMKWSSVRRACGSRFRRREAVLASKAVRLL